MAQAIVTVKIMPEEPSVDLKKVEHAAMHILDKTLGLSERRVEIEPIAFGLKAVKITFVVDEKKGSPDPIAEEMAGIPHVMSAEIVDVRRAIG
jgi:elongation factor 1-beta